MRRSTEAGPASVSGERMRSPGWNHGIEYDAALGEGSVIPELIPDVVHEKWHLARETAL
ncbi:MAG: hypothetical protein ABI382_06115 [Nakamurella sp.]